MTIRPRWLAALALAGGLIVVVAVVVGLPRSPAPPSGEDARDHARARLAELREELAACNQELTAEQARFQVHEAAVDSLRAAVHDYESDERTVPAEEFEAYMEAFTAHNRAVDAWHERAEALQARWAECRDLAERHNAVVDSLTAREGHLPAGTS